MTDTKPRDRRVIGRLVGRDDPERDIVAAVPLEMNCTDDAADNVGPLATLLYGISILYCTPTSLAQGGAGLGTCGCPPAKLRELCDQAGFSKLERLPVDNPFNILYAATP